MKNIKYIVLITVSLLFSNCNTNDDGFYNSVYLNGANLVTIEPHASTYAVGEKLYINADFPRYFDESGHPLDLFKTSEATEFAFSYVIEKQVDATNWEVIYVNDNQLDIVNGDAQNGSFVYGVCNLNTIDINPANQNYEYRVGFPLLAAGTYRLSFGYNSDSTNSVELRSLSPDKQLIVNINSLVTGLDGNGYYNFTVN